MEGKNMKKWKLILIILIILILIIGLYYWVSPYLINQEIEYSYEVIIEPNNDGAYYVYIPLLIHDNEEISKISKSIKIVSGNGEISFIETKYGSALNLSSNAPIKLALSGNEFKDIKVEGDIPQIFLSLDNDLDGDNDKAEWDSSFTQYNLFLNSSYVDYLNFDLAFKVNSEPASFEGSVKLNGKVYDGWNIINGTMDASME
jgi:hypothetical protein